MRHGPGVRIRGADVPEVERHVIHVDRHRADQSPEPGRPRLHRKESGEEEPGCGEVRRLVQQSEDEEGPAVEVFRERVEPRYEPQRGQRKEREGDPTGPPGDGAPGCGRYRASARRVLTTTLPDPDGIVAATSVHGHLRVGTGWASGYLRGKRRPGAG